MLKITTVLVLFCIFFSCNKNSKDEADKISTVTWMLGSWKCQTQNGILIENWSKVNDTTFAGLSLFVNGTDTIHYESIVLQQVGDDLKYNTTIKGQNNDASIQFLLNKYIDNTFQFENLANDYPQKISYQSFSGKKLKVVISGVIAGKAKSENYMLIKSK